jgi:hypothetical protein
MHNKPKKMQTAQKPYLKQYAAAAVDNVSPRTAGNSG